MQACLHLIGTRPWDEVSMADVAAAAGVSKPLLYHYFSTKSELYLATIRSAADELIEATRPDPALPVDVRLREALDAHLDWIDEHSLAYRADPPGRHQLRPQRPRDRRGGPRRCGGPPRRCVRLRRASRPSQRIALRGWVGFLEGACLDWLATRDITKQHLARLLAASVGSALRAAAVDPEPRST